MDKKIFVGNLAFSSTEGSISELFSQYGSVVSCRLISDRDTGRSKGFAFVEMSSNEEADKAISSLDGREVDGRALKVNEARPKTTPSYGSSSHGTYRDDQSGFSGRSERRSY